MITSYNYPAMGDALIIVLAPNVTNPKINQFDNVVAITDSNTNQIIGINVFGMGQQLGIQEDRGQIFLDEKQINQLNQLFKSVGLETELTVSPSKLVVGYVESMQAHPDSDHLHITQTRVTEDKTLQIVSGSPNMAENIKVVVAQPGTMMPSGEIIWDGALRGIDSAGMIVSGRELRLPGAPDKPGALILPETFGEVGEPFDFEKGAQLFEA
ncbi:YtpR family tRNA-binding protein [Leuconostoc fallax]|uniref:tRNA-binding domain-containing protein n=1 Tax=Leuconostoc fallax TaxID=1251 RepID=A0A4R5N7Y2_9LACO|nr:DUF4479 domain-containing protein [Leuconostoc fallax]MBU7455742.1 DUF4479 domain-containing protein [Leuconostoc fallax]TDG68019.1 hypothetical protein C5L23_000325 [Leuconostoc fallax]